MWRLLVKILLSAQLDLVVQPCHKSPSDPLLEMHGLILIKLSPWLRPKVRHSTPKLQIYLYIYIYVCLYTYKYVYRYVYICIYIYIYIYIYRQIYIYNIYLYIYIYTYIFSSIYVYIDVNNNQSLLHSVSWVETNLQMALRHNICLFLS